MAGTPHFKANCYLTGLTLANYSQSIFKITWDFFKYLETQGYCTEIARNNGLAATGTDFHDGANPFQTNAWAVFEFVATVQRPLPYYVHFQWTASPIFGTSPGNPALFRGTAGSGTASYLGFSMAAAIDEFDAPFNPFIPVSGSMGSHVKSDPVWTTPTNGTLYVFPLSNATGGAFATSKQNMMGYTSNVTTNLFMDLIADEDNWFINIAARGTPTLDNFCVGGGFYIPPAGITAVAPLFMFASQGASLDRTNIWGTTTGTEALRDGGITSREGVTTKDVGFGWNLAMEKVQPNTQTDTPSRYGLYPMKVCSNLSDVGEADPEFWRVCYGFTVNDTNVGATWMCFGISSSITVVKHILPWDGSTVRWNTGGATRDGVIS